MGAPMKCNTCDARWYGMGSTRCMDCGSDDIDVDFAFYKQWPARIAKTQSLKDTVTPTYDKGLFFIGAQFRIWSFSKGERDTLAGAVLGLIAARAEADGGMDVLDNGFSDLGPDLDMDFFEMECHGLAERLGLTHWDDDGLEHFLDRVAARVSQGKATRDLRRAHELAAMIELGRA